MTSTTSTGPRREQHSGYAPSDSRSRPSFLGGLPPRHRFLFLAGVTAPSTTGMVVNLTDAPLGVAAPCFLASVVLAWLALRRMPRHNLSPIEERYWRLTPRRWRFGPKEWRLGLPTRATFRPRIRPGQHHG